MASLSLESPGGLERIQSGRLNRLPASYPKRSALQRNKQTAHTMTNSDSESKTAGAPRGNRNALRHGMHAAQLPKDCRYIELRCNKLRRQLEDSVLAKSESVSVTESALIQSAVRHERRAALAERWLRVNDSELKLGDRLGLLKTVSDATDSRDKCLERLKLNASDNSPWDGV